MHPSPLRRTTFLAGLGPACALLLAGAGPGAAPGPHPSSVQEAPAREGPEADLHALLQRGDTAAADSLLAEFRRRAGDLPPTGASARLAASVPARHALGRGAWAEAVSLEPRRPDHLPWGEHPGAEAVTWFARGVGGVLDGRPGAASEAVARLDELRRAAGAEGHRREASRIDRLRLAVAALVAEADGIPEQAVTLLEDAALLEERDADRRRSAEVPASLPPVLPLRQLLGDVLLRDGRPREALAAYRRSLEVWPGRRGALEGALRAACAAGREGEAREAAAALRELVGEPAAAPCPGPSIRPLRRAPERSAAGALTGGTASAPSCT